MWQACLLPSLESMQMHIYGESGPMYPTIQSTVAEIFGAQWEIGRGVKVPNTEDLKLKNSGRLIDATYLYADLAGSSNLAHNVEKEITASIIQAYITSATRILREYGGAIKSFDGDRVMAIYMGEDKNRKAVRAALAINWAVQNVIAPAIESKWPEVARKYKLGHGIGIDTGEALIVRGGARNNNDLISIGDAPNDAAKLSDYRGSTVNITKSVYDDLDDTHRFFGDLRFWERNLGSRVLGFNAVTYHSTVSWGM